MSKLLNNLGGLPLFDGPEPVGDQQRLTDQLGKISDCMRDGRWRTLAEIEAITGAPQAVSYTHLTLPTTPYV